MSLKSNAQLWAARTEQYKFCGLFAEKSRTSIAAALLLVAVTGNVAAADQGTGTNMDADTLVEQVLQQNAGIAAMRAAVDAAQARIDPAGALPDAQLSGAVAPETIGGFETPSGRERSTNIRVEISQEFPWPGTLGLRADAARQEAAAVGDDVAALRLRLAAATRSTYAEWRYVHQALEINAANLDLVDELRQVAEDRYAAGLASQQDVLQAEVELQRIKHQAIKLRRAKRAVRAKINELLNRPARKPLAPPIALPRPTALPPYARLRQISLAEHPELAHVAKRIAANKDREALAQKDFYPDFKVFGGYNSLWDAGEKRWIVGAGISLPLDRSKYRAQLDEARANTKRLGYELEDMRVQLLSELEQAHAAVEEADHEIQLYEEELIPRTQENLSAARSEYGSGGGAFLDVIIAEQLKLNAELELERARADYFAALAQLKRWTGGELPQPGGASNNAIHLSGDS